MLPYEQAIDIVLDIITPLPATEVPLEQAHGKVLAEAVTARWDLPGQDNSAMDGFALAAATVETGQAVEVVDFLPAGRQLAHPVAPGRAVRIMTGAPLPAGCDTVVPIEDVDVDGSRIRLRRRPEPGRDVRRQGEEFKTGETLLTPGSLLLSGEIGLLAAAGVERVNVHPTPRVAFLVTGDELVELGQDPSGGKIVNSNLYMIRARLHEEDVPVLELGTVGDRPDVLAERLERGFSCDLVLTTGGVSVGDHDFVRSLCDRLGMTVHFWKLAIKPGKPVLFATRNGIPFFGLPGNPAATAATFELLVRPALRRLAGQAHPAPVRLSATLAAPVSSRGTRELFLWGRLDYENGRPLFHPTNRQGAGQNRSLEKFNALLPVPPGATRREAGDIVSVLLVRMPG